MIRGVWIFFCRVFEAKIFCSASLRPKFFLFRIIFGIGPRLLGSLLSNSINWSSIKPHKSHTLRHLRYGLGIWRGWRRLSVWVHSNELRVPSIHHVEKGFSASFSSTNSFRSTLVFSLFLFGLAEVMRWHDLRMIDLINEHFPKINKGKPRFFQKERVLSFSTNNKIDFSHK